VNPYQDLRAELPAETKSATGTVTAISGHRLTVRTAAGIVDAQTGDNAIYRIGDEVLLNGNIVLGRVSAASSVPIYRV